MNGAPAFLPNPPQSCDDRFMAVTIPAGGEVDVLSFTTRAALRGFLCMVGTHTDALPDDIIWNVKINGAKLYPYSDYKIQISDIADWRFLPWPVELPQASPFTISAKNNSAVDSVCTARAMIYYCEPK